MTAIRAYDNALELQDSVIVWKNQGIAYMDWAINNQTIAIEVGERPLYSYTRQLIEHYSSTNSLLVDTNLMQSSYECFCKAIIYSPKDPELLIYKAIASLYTFNFSASDPISTFNDTITYIKALHSDKLTVPQLSILKDATYGLGMAYLEMDLDTEANKCFTALVVAFLDDDDTWRDGKVDLLRERFSKNPDLVLLDHSNFVVDENGTILSRELSINGKWLKSSDIAIRRSWATPRAWLVRSAQRENDLVWVFLAEVDAPNGIEVVDLPLTSWTHHASNISRPRSPTVEEFCHKESEHCRVRIRAEKVMLRYGDLRLVDRMAPTLVYHRRRLAGFEFLSALEEGHHPRGTARRFLRSYGHADRLLALALMAAISPRVARLILFRLGSYNGVPGAKP